MQLQPDRGEHAFPQVRGAIIDRRARSVTGSEAIVPCGSLGYDESNVSRARWESRTQIEPLNAVQKVWGSNPYRSADREPLSESV